MTFSQIAFLEQLQEVDAYKFEHFVAKLWELQNWDTYVTQGANDGGIDVVAKQSEPFPKKQVIQVKRYDPSNSVGRPDIQKVASVKQEQADVDTVVVVTTGRFTDGAEEVAKKLNVKLIDGPQLYNLIDALDAFKLSRSFIDSELKSGGTVQTDVEVNTPDISLRKTGVTEGSQPITKFDWDTQPQGIPTSLPSLIQLRGNIANNFQDIQSDLNSAEKAFHKEQYFDAVDKYAEINGRRIELRREIARYDAGLTHADSKSIVHLPSTETFTTQIAQVTERVNEHFQEAYRVVERAKGLELLVSEIRDRVDSIENRIDSGDQLRHNGDVEKGHSKYEQAKYGLEQVRETIEIYQGLVSTYDDAVIKCHEELSQDVSLSELETEITSRIDSKEQHLDIPKVAEDATGSFSAKILTGNTGELFDKELIEYIGKEEQLEFVFEPPRRGFRTISPQGIEETPYSDTLQSGSCFLVVTDQRIQFIAGADDHDETRSIKYEKLSDVTASTETTSRGIEFITADGTKYQFIGIRDYTSDLEPAADYVRKQLE